MVKVAPSILSADFARLGEEVRAVEAAGADWLHLDVMDGHFVPNLTIGPAVVEAVRKITKLTLDTHLMIENPQAYITPFADAGSEWLSVHAEVLPKPGPVIEAIRKAGMHPSIVINPETPFDRVVDILPDVDMLLVMSVHPGFGGQKFIESSLDKVAAAARLRSERGLSFLIQIDGGITKHNAAQVVAKGADVLVSGSGVFKEADYAAAIAAMHHASA